MSFWVELHCDRKGESGFDCWSNHNAHPGVMVERALGVAREDLFKQARAAGWTYRGRLWLCPHCRHQPDLRSE